MMQPGLDNYTDIGRYLRDSRESLNLHLEDVAHALNIRYRYLLAIEEGKFSTLPGPIYTKGFIQSYATYMGLDKEAIGKAYDKLSAGQKHKIFFLEPTRFETRPDRQVLLLSVILVATIYLWWHSFVAIDKNFDNEVRDLPEVTATPTTVAKPKATSPQVGKYAPGCLDPGWQKLYPPCQHVVQPRGVKLDLFELYESPVFRKDR